MTCSADVSVYSFDSTVGDTEKEIVFKVVVDSCLDSKGRFEFDVVIKDTEDSSYEDRVGRAEVWGRTHDTNKETVKVYYDKIRETEFIDNVVVTEVTCTCHD